MKFAVNDTFLNDDIVLILSTWYRDQYNTNTIQINTKYSNVEFNLKVKTNLGRVVDCVSDERSQRTRSNYHHYI